MINGSISHSVGRFGLVILFALLLFLAACGGGGGGSAIGGGGGGGNAGIGEGDAMMDFPEETTTPLLAANGQKFEPNSGGFAGESDIATMESVRAALAELGALRAARPDSLSDSDSFHEQLLKGVEVTGNAGDYELVVRDINYRRRIVGQEFEQEFERSMERFMTYGYLVLVWGAYEIIQDDMPVQYYSAWIPSHIPSGSAPNQGTATYDLEGRASLLNSYSTDDTYDIHEIILNGELTADFEAGTVGGHLESDYGYMIKERSSRGDDDGDRFFNAFSLEDITAEKYFGNDRTNTPSELNGRLRLDFLRGELLDSGEIYRGARWHRIEAGEEFCATHGCFAADVNIYPGMATGDFATLADSRLGPQLQRRVGHENGNNWGHALGHFIGPNEQQLYGRVEVQNNFEPINPADDPVISTLRGFFVGGKQPEQN